MARRIRERMITDVKNKKDEGLGHGQKKKREMQIKWEWKRR